MNKLHQHTTLQLLLNAWSNDRNRKIGTDSMLRIQQLVNQLPEECEAASFRNMLAALLVKSPEEQKEFYALFKQCQEDANKLIEGKVEGKKEKSATKEEDKAKKKFQYSIVYFILFFIMLIGGVYWINPAKEVVEGAKDELRVIREQLSIGDTLPSIDIRAAENTAPIESINPSSTQKTNRNHTVVLDDSGFVTFIANGDSTANVRDTFDAYLNYTNQIDTVRLIVTLTEKAKVTIDTPIVDKAFLDPIPLLTPNRIDSLIISKEEIAAGEWWDKWKWPIVAAVIILLGILLWGIWRWIQYQRAKVVADLQNTDKAPYIWHPETGAINQEWLEEVSRPLLNRFRSRTPDDALLLDIPATIKVTSQQAGRLSLQYTNRTLPPNYLLLIDRYSAQDHQARLFDALYQHLKKEEIPVYRYYFNGDLRICTNEAFPNGITLVELMQKHAAAKLLIVGEGMGLLSQRSGRLAPWTAILKKWKNKVLLSPKVRNEWGVFEKVLEDLFLVLPASPQGLSMAMESFLAVDTLMQAELWPKVKDSILSPIALDGPLIVSLHEQFEKTPSMVDWIAACAVWPKLSWDLTLHLGSIIDEQLIRFDHLREMNRLPWFIQGYMPREVRELLLDYLQVQGLEEKVRTAIQELFEKLKNKPQKGSVADDYYQMNIILNELFLNPDKEKKKQLEKQFADYLAAGNDPDFVALRLLDRKPNRIDQLLGNRFKKYVYKQGLPKLGVQKWIWLATTWAVLSLGIGIGAYFSGETALCPGLEVAYKEHTLCLENERDRLLYYQQLAKDAIEAQNHEQVDSIKALADAIQPLDSIFYLNTAYNYHNYGVSAYNCSVEEDPTCGFQVPKDSLNSLACLNFNKGASLLGGLSNPNFPLRFEQFEVLSKCDDTAIMIDDPKNSTAQIIGYLVDAITNEPIANAEIRLGYSTEISFLDLREGNSNDVFQATSRPSGNFNVLGLPQKNESILIRITQDLYDILEDDVSIAQQSRINSFRLQPNEEAFIVISRESGLKTNYEAYLERFPDGSWAEDFQLALDDLDEAAWQNAQVEGTEEACRKYLDEWPNGLYRVEAWECAEPIIEDIPTTDRIARKFFTSDSKGEIVPDQSDFAKQLLSGLQAYNRSSISFTANDLFNTYVINAKPKPAMGSFGKNDSGASFSFTDKNGQALFFAINQYDSETIADLRSPIRDASSIAKELQSSYRFATEIVENPTYRQIREKIDDYKRRYENSFLKADEPLIIFFSGVGYSANDNSYFLARDSRENQLVSSAFNFNLLRILIDDIKSDNILVIIDACYSDGFNEVTPSPTLKDTRSSTPDVTPSQLPIPPTELIPAGTFTMGCLSEERDGDCVDNEKPARTDLKVNAFYMGKYEVTNEEFAAFLNAEGNQEERGSEWVNLEGKYNNVKCRIQKDGDRFVVEEGFEKHPMIYVSWYGARAYCKWLSQQTGQNYRLPSEAEWEYAARGAEQGAKDKFLYSGSSTIDKVAWYRDNSGNQTHEVGKQQPNQLGLYDMSGNVWEWCADPWHSNYDNAPKDARVWEEGGNNSYWVLRGGSWVNNSWSCRVATRFNNDPGNRYFNFGFRVARDL